MTDIAFTEAMMAVNTCCQSAFRIVKVHPAQMPSQQYGRKIRERFRIRLEYTVIPGSNMAVLSMRTPTRDLSSRRRRRRCSGKPEVTA